MKLSIATFCALMLLVHSKPEVRSQSKSLRQGEGDSGAGNPSLPSAVNAVRKQKSNGFEDDVILPSDHRLLETSYWEQVASFDQLQDSTNGGYSVSISGDGSLLAAAPYTNGGAGIVRFFENHNRTWEENTDLRLFGAATFGSDVSLSGNGQRVAIGARSASRTGRVLIYEMSNGTWGEPLQGITGEDQGEQSGASVALSKDGKTLAIGAPQNNGNGFNAGHVRVYRWDDAASSFKQMGEDIDGEAGNEGSGWSVALSQDGSALAVGAPNANGNVGKVRVLYWEPDEINETEGSWKQRGSTINGDGGEFGRSVDLSEDGKIIAVGAIGGNYAKVFQWKDSNEDEDDWEQIGETQTGGDDASMWSVSLSTPPSSDSTILALGQLTYKLGNDGQSWEKLAGEIPGSVVSLSSDGQTLAVGNPFGSGAVTVHRALSSGSSTSGSNGDPHFRTWNGGHFEYHGQCDMILVKDEDFADGLGLEVQIRTKLVKFWSFIQNAAIRIGEDTLEMQGSPDLTVNKGNNHYWINSVYQGEVTTLGGFPVKANYAGKHKNKRWFFSKYGGGNKISRSFEIDLSSKYPGQKIVIGSYKEFVRVDFQNAGSEAFGNSVGMLGDFATGKMLARDGVTELKDYTELGHEWQVHPEEGAHFRNVSRPQYPEKCIDPEARAMKRRRRRLGESSVTEEQAETACAPIEDVLDRKDCVYDVLVTQDLTMVGAY